MTKIITMFGVRAYLNNNIYCYSTNELGKIHKQYTRPSMLDLFRVPIILIDND